MRNVCNVVLPQAIGDIISSIGIDIGTAAADSIGYRAPAWYRSNPTTHAQFGNCAAQFAKCADRQIVRNVHLMYVNYSTLN